MLTNFLANLAIANPYSFLIDDIYMLYNRFKLNYLKFTNYYNVSLELALYITLARLSFSTYLF
jgi:hypothetical protein